MKTAFYCVAVALATLLVCFALTSCGDDHHGYIPPEPNPPMVLDCEYVGDGVVLVSIHNTVPVILETVDVNNDALLDSLTLAPGDSVVYHNACPGDYQYVLGSLDVDLPEVVCEANVPVDDTPAPRDGKVLLCHKGKTISVSDKAAEAHLNHGDLLGPCPEDVGTPKFERKYPCEDGGLTLAE